MSKAAASKKTTTAGVDAQRLVQNAMAMDAVTRFWSSTIGMGWRLAITVLVPLILGVKLDERLNSSPSLTLTGFFIAIAGASVIVWRTVKEVNSQIAADESSQKTDVPEPSHETVAAEGGVDDYGLPISSEKHSHTEKRSHTKTESHKEGSETA